MNARVEPAHDDLLKNSKKARRKAGPRSIFKASD
jgi:hypothetical protein